MMRLLLLTLVFSACSSQAQEFKKLDWLIGQWERQNVRPGRTALEAWERDVQKGLVGIGVTLQGADTVFVEKLSIIEKDGELFYVANVSSNASPTFFKFTSMDENAFVSENPEHDFPKKIAYKLEGDILTATISGDGKEIPFLFKKVD